MMELIPLVQENGGIMMSRQLSTKDRAWDCHQICLMLTQSMASQGHSSLVQKNVRNTNWRKVLGLQTPGSVNRALIMIWLSFAIHFQILLPWRLKLERHIS